MGRREDGDAQNAVQAEKKGHDPGPAVPLVLKKSRQVGPEIAIEDKDNGDDGQSPPCSPAGHFQDPQDEDEGKHRVPRRRCDTDAENPAFELNEKVDDRDQDRSHEQVIEPGDSAHGMAGPDRHQSENEKSAEGDMESAKKPGINGPEDQNRHVKKAHQSCHQNHTPADEPGQLSLRSDFKILDLVEFYIDVFFRVHDEQPRNQRKSDCGGPSFHFGGRSFSGIATPFSL
ncbi:MAG: hypothetical protein H6Q48_5257 [Deltaproteobacteria bacterium]|nr:hypothetical protein [Deltaproteobacteria bacterium]